MSDRPTSATTRIAFPSPYDAPAPPGADGWQSMYAYNLVFHERRRAQDDEKFWFCDSQHWPRVLKPFETIGLEFSVASLGQYNSRQLLIPTANGIEYRLHNGYVFMSPLPVDPAEAELRASDFIERAGYYFEHWKPLLEKWHRKLRTTIAELEEVSFTRLPDVIPLAHVLDGRGTGPGTELLADFDRLIALAYRAWQYHFEFLNLGYVAYLDLFLFCREVFPRISDQAIGTMVQGATIDLFRPDDELKRLAKIAVRDSLDNLFVDITDADTLLDSVEAHPNGGHWLQEWRLAHDPWFNFTTGNGFYADDEYWRDAPLTPLQFIADYIRQLRAGTSIDRMVDERIVERDRITEEYAHLISGELRKSFREKLRLARTVYPYVENHNFYIEHWTMGVFWRKARQLSRLLHEQGFWNDPHDMFYLRRDEVREALFDYVNAWMVGTEPVGPDHWPAEIERRRAIVEALAAERPQPAYNAPPARITEPLTLMLWGITDDQIQNWLHFDEESSGVLRGIAASPGIVEGIARVIVAPSELATIQEGEILVASVTAPSWAPVFGKIRATVTDIGGMMSHAAIVCREYGVPAVTGTGSGTAEIRTGQRIRVDGNTGAVTLLS